MDRTKCFEAARRAEPPLNYEQRECFATTTPGKDLMLIEIAIGDAYGAGFEYVAEYLVRERNNLAAYIQHPRHHLAPGCYTDDTQMTIAVVEAMLTGREWTV